jgi:hypothetical protein
VDELSGGQFIFLFLVLVWLVIVVTGMLISMRRREQAHRERLAMIERGLAPPPEMYPNKYDAPPWAGGGNGPWTRRDQPQPRYFARKLGVLTIFAAAGIGWLLFVLNEERVALAIAGLIGMIGVGLIIISLNLGSAPYDEYRGPRGPMGPPGPPPA